MYNGLNISEIDFISVSFKRLKYLSCDGVYFSIKYVLSNLGFILSEICTFKLIISLPLISNEKQNIYSECLSGYWNKIILDVCLHLMNQIGF